MIAVALDVVLGLVVLEGAALVLFYRATGRGVAPHDLVANLAAGFFLMLTARLALGPHPPVLPPAAAMAAALVAHVVDLGRRWRA